LGVRPPTTGTWQRPSQPDPQLCDSPQLHCQRFCHVHQASIAVTAAEIAGVAGVTTADIDNAAPARRLHERDDGPGTAQCPTYFTLKSSIKSSSTTVSIGPVAVAEPPGADPLLTRMCRPPSCVAASAITRSTCSLLVTWLFHRNRR